MVASAGTPGGDGGVAAVVLAAGRSQRFGAPKQLARLAGTPLIGHVVQRVLASVVTEVVVVLGHEADAIRGVLPADGRVRTVHNPRHGEGMSTSLIAGIGALGQHVEGAVVVLGDEPGIEPRDIDAVVRALKAGWPVARVRYSDGPGHPVGFRRARWPELRALSGDQGARSVLLRSQVHEIAVPRPGPRDVDEPGDLAALAPSVFDGVSGDGPTR